MDERAGPGMSAITGLDWDAWRNAYPTLTYAEQQDFHSAIYAQYPEQRHYSERHCRRAINSIPRARRIVELGGWDGALARAMLDRHASIQQWVNVELCREAAAAGRGLGYEPRYSAPELNGFYWDWDHGPWHCDLFVASHTIEHLTSLDLAKVLASTRARALYFDAPLYDKPVGWQGFTGTHILETGWTGVTALCREHGYTLAWAEDHKTDPSSGDWARACLYRKDTAA